MAKRRRKTRPRPVVIPSAAKRTAVYRRWLRWWKLLRGDITNIAFHRYICREVTAIVDANPAVKVPNYCLLLEAAGLTRVVPVVQYDWKPYRTAWL